MQLSAPAKLVILLLLLGGALFGAYKFFGNEKTSTTDYSDTTELKHVDTITITTEPVLNTVVKDTVVEVVNTQTKEVVATHKVTPKKSTTPSKPKTVKPKKTSTTTNSQDSDDKSNNFVPNY